MQTEQLRALVKEAHAKRGGKLWPNGLGFDWRRWEYCWSEARNRWQALYRPEGYGKGHHTKVGYGETPEVARATARKVED